MDKKMKAILRHLYLILVPLIMVGCVTSPTAASKKAGIKSVQVEKRVDSKQGMRYGVDLSGGGLANALAGMIINSAGQEAVERMSKVMHANQIIVSQIVYDHTVRRLQEMPELQVVDDGGQGVIVVSITQFGFDNSGLKFSKKYPVIVLEAKLTDNAGKRIWSGCSSIGQLTSDGLGATLEEYESNPARLRADWNAQIENVVEHLFPNE